MDVINAAKKISEAGSKLDKLCRQIADQVRQRSSIKLLIFDNSLPTKYLPFKTDILAWRKRSVILVQLFSLFSKSWYISCSGLQCPDSATKTDLLAYLQRIALYCHQLNITSKVKADVQNISGALIVSGVSIFSICFLCFCCFFHCRIVVISSTKSNISSKEYFALDSGFFQMSYFRMSFQNARNAVEFYLDYMLEFCFCLQTTIFTLYLDDSIYGNFRQVSWFSILSQSMNQWNSFAYYLVGPKRNCIPYWELYRIIIIWNF